MSIRKTILLTAGLTALLSAAASAHDLRPVDRAQSRQIGAIEHLRKTGQLTRREQAGLLAEQRSIAERQRIARADGVVTAREYRDLREAQAAAGANIRREASDGQKNYFRVWKDKHGLVR
ncbi:MAG: hypothetical protein R3D68_19040 [Hyphomicrobiaceae bacterium]